MSKDKKDDASAEAPKKSKKMLIIIIAAVVVLGGGGAGAFFMLKSDKATAAPKPVKGAVVSMDTAITINLADAHYLKMGFTLQLTEEAGEKPPDIAEAIDLAIDQYTGMEVAVLETEKGREKAKEELLKKVEKAYLPDGEKESYVMDMYFTQFVTQ